ncbi:high affinity immunoglobulin epsilon receptor subunit beta [Orycteropus afer afer]|uniref:high affinity immunoglobulin epsilon receptor subunit beta n=1 Tax=Orycteropus afer afer TaxID=1230840 RepID=UPI001C5C9FF8|nr:high affinity immunoglobulin epsilon receptor subunit beta [Orycteropus afer afer]
MLIDAKSTSALGLTLKVGMSKTGKTNFQRDRRNMSRADLALPNPQGQSSAADIGLSEIALHDDRLLEKPAPSPPHHTWLTLLKKELEFLGVTQILIGLICLSFGTIVYSMINISEFEREIFSSFKAGYPLWGAVFFAISGFLSVICERNDATYLVSCNSLSVIEKVQGRLGANTISSVTAATGIIILIINLKESSASLSNCLEVDQDDFCFVASFSTEIVAMLLFLTILGFCSAVLLMIYGVGELFKKDKVPEDRLYEELNIYSPIYSELEDRGETSPSTD